MRYAAATLVAVLTLAACVPPASQTSSSPTASSAPSRQPSPTATATASPSPSPSGPDVVLNVTRVSVPSDFRYLESWGDRFVVFDMERRTVAEVVRIDSIGREIPPGSSGNAVSVSTDGKALLITSVLRANEGVVHLVRPESGEVRRLFRGSIFGAAVISPDGTRFTIGRADADPARNGLWIGSTADGSMSRQIADVPGLVGSPPQPLAFSPDGSLLAFALGRGESGPRAGVIGVYSSEVEAERLRASAEGIDRVILLRGVTGAEFVSDSAVFVWSTRTALGGETLSYLYEFEPKRVTELYRPTAPDVLIAEATWRPRAQQFATLEVPSCCGLDRRRTVWLRGRDGSSRNVGDVGPFIGGLWWSRDGARLYAVMGGDDSVGGVVELLTGQGGMSFCRRGGGPPPAPCG